MTPDPWRVELARRAAKDLRALDRPVRDRVLDALDRLAGESPSGGVVKLSGRDEWRLRVGDWRVRFQRDDSVRVIYALRVLPRGRAYRD